MYCHYCAKKRPDDAVYCQQCGRLLAADDDAEAAAGLEPSVPSVPTIPAPRADSHAPAEMRGGKSSVRAILLPLLLAVFTSCGLAAYYMYEEGLNDRVLELQAEAKAKALAGSYSEALEKLRQAAETRPAFAAIHADLEVVLHVMELEEKAEEADKLLKEQKTKDAEQAIVEARSLLKGHNEPIYAKVRERLDGSVTQLGILKLKQELDGLQTVEELEARLQVAKSLDGGESAEVQAEIIGRIADICYKDAETLLLNKNYSGALAVTAKALEHAQDNEKLLALENRIKQEKEKYEKAEQQRLEQAMQKAAAEELKNQTAAVEVVLIQTSLDEYGDLTVEAQLKNVATRPIYSVVVNYIVYDAEGNEIASGKAEATPNYVEPGETMTFLEIIPGVNAENTTAAVDHATWYLD
ncbi:FxLYD domain-containing protein [Paenibacillus sp. N4]|uniref:FxLYD domain-containing protein n=1 Tax=Paenibacillus vietnamensis TaxID=2590547 RepID=UPI001CD08B67|nr:FxLYD domain-containing protein [Paenibacillus vietnamensis]MCA0756799.1 FxLYD domain-containing protein [Paenibacillus vietnamensis]